MEARRLSGKLFYNISSILCITVLTLVALAFFGERSVVYAQNITQCSDGIDNDGDGKIDNGGIACPQARVALLQGDTLRAWDEGHAFLRFDPSVGGCGGQTFTLVQGGFFTLPCNGHITWISGEVNIAVTVDKVGGGGRQLLAQCDEVDEDVEGQRGNDCGYPNDEDFFDDVLKIFNRSCSLVGGGFEDDDICTVSNCSPLPADPDCSGPGDPTEGPPPQCSDGIDNDGDGVIDMNDFSCSNPDDNDETNPKAQCQDGLDNDQDGFVDFPADPGCSSKQDNDETNATTPAQCQDGIDNDGDGATDFPNDFSCSSGTDNDETNPKAQCQDGLDNDQDGFVDHPQDPGCSSKQDNDETNAVSGQPDMIVTKVGPATVSQNGQISYKLQIQNVGGAAAGSVTLTDAIPNGTSLVSASAPCINNGNLVSCSYGTLGPNEVRIVDLVVSVGSAACNTTFNNTANVSTTPADANAANNVSLNVATTVQCPQPPQCQDGVDNDGDGAVDMNDFSCSNPDDNDETNPKAQCQDSLDNDGDGFVDFPADPGCSSKQDNDEFNQAQLPQCKDGIDNDGDGAVDHPADFSCSNPDDNDETNPKAACQDGADNDQDGFVDFPQDPGCTSKQDNDETNGSNQADMILTKVGPATTTAGGNISYKIQAHNIGGAAAANVIVTDIIPAGTSFVSATAPCAFNTGTVTCNLGTFAANEVRIIDLVVNVGDASCNTKFQNQASLTTSPQDANTVNNTSLVVETTVQCGTPPPQCKDGVDNDGDGAIDHPSDFSCSNPDDNDETNPKAACQDGADNDQDGYIDFPADPGCSSKQDNDETNAATLADIVVTKQAASASVTQGQNLTYTIHVTNVGGTAAANVVVHDALPQMTTFVSADSPCTFAGNLLTCNLGTLAPNQNVILHMTVGTGGCGCNITVHNTASATTTSPESTTANNSSVEVHTTVSCPQVPQCKDGIDNDGDGAVDHPTDFSCSNPDDNDETNPKAQCQDSLDNDQDGFVDYPADPGCSSKQDNDETNGGGGGGGADLIVTKVGQGTIPQGAPLTYKIHVTNLGSLAAANVKLTDTIPAGTTFLQVSDSACSFLGGSLNCTFGSLAGNQTKIVDLTVGTAGAACNAVLKNKASAETSTFESDTANNTSLTVETTVQCQSVPQCKDGADNDGDGAIDFPNDFSCSNPDDNDETLPKAQCQDSVDNGDAEDALVDAQDPGCHTDGNANNPNSYNPQDNDETNGGGGGGNQADLIVTKVGQSTVTQGINLPYKLQVHNIGGGAAAGVVLTDVIPAGTSFVSATSPCTFNVGTLTCNLGTLGANEVRVIDLVLGTSGAGCGASIQNTASATTGSTDANSANNTSLTVATTIQCGGGTPAQCNDSADNDGDGLVDSGDPGCHSDGNAGNPNSYNPQDNDETNAVATACTGQDPKIQALTQLYGVQPRFGPSGKGGTIVYWDVNRPSKQTIFQQLQQQGLAPLRPDNYTTAALQNILSFTNDYRFVAVEGACNQQQLLAYHNAGHPLSEDRDCNDAGPELHEKWRYLVIQSNQGTVLPDRAFGGTVTLGPAGDSMDGIGDGGDHGYVAGICGGSTQTANASGQSNACPATGAVEVTFGSNSWVDGDGALVVNTRTGLMTIQGSGNNPAGGVFFANVKLANGQVLSQRFDLVNPGQTGQLPGTWGQAYVGANGSVSNPVSRYPTPACNFELTPNSTIDLQKNGDLLTFQWQDGNQQIQCGPIQFGSAKVNVQCGQ